MDKPAGILSPDWLLAGFDAGQNLFHFAEINRQTYTRSSFLDHRIEPMPDKVTTLGAEAVDEVLESANPGPAAYIFHTAFCASTLLASCLDSVPLSLVLKEPLVLSKLAGLKREGAAPDGAAWSALLRRVTGLLDRSYSGEAVIVKPSNFANALMPDLLDEEWVKPEVSRKFVLMSCSLRSLLISILKKQDEARQSMPAFLEALLQDSDYREIVSVPGTASLNVLQQSVVFWHCQRYQFQRVMERSGADRFTTVTMEAFLSSPLDCLQAISDFLDLPFGHDRLVRIVESGAFRQHSKDQEAAYSPDQRLQEEQAVASRYESEISAVLDWARPLLQSLPPAPLLEGEDPIQL